MSEKIYLYPVWTRIWHLFNAILCLFLILSGISMQYSVMFRFDLAVSLHNIAGILLTINYLIFFIGNLSTKNGKYYKFNKKEIGKQLQKQLKYYTGGIFKGEKAPFPVNEEQKFNPLQKVSYQMVMYLAIPLLFITGWAMLFPEIIINRIFHVSGLFLTDLLHITMGFVVSVFMVVHIYFCTTGTKFGSIFKNMITGWAESH